MLFAAKPKGFFIECSDTRTLIARTSGVAGGPLVVEEIRECAVGDDAAWANVLNKFIPKKSKGSYLQGVVGVHPARRLVRRVTFDLKRMRDAGYLNEVAETQLRIDFDKYTLALLNPDTGLEYDVGKAAAKDALVCGLPSDDVLTLQEELLARQIYPERLEVGTVALLGGLTNYLGSRKLKAPVLVLELGMEETHSFIVSGAGVESSRPIPQGLAAMVPLVQKELGLKDEDSARKLFFSNSFDFTSLGPILVKRLLKELLSSIGFYEVQTGQSIGHVLCVHLPVKLEWLEQAIASQLGVPPLRLELVPWLQERGITLADTMTSSPVNPRWLGLFSLMVQHDAPVPSQ